MPLHRLFQQNRAHAVAGSAGLLQRRLSHQPGELRVSLGLRLVQLVAGGDEPFTAQYPLRTLPARNDSTTWSCSALRWWRAGREQRWALWARRGGLPRRLLVPDQ